jgi:Uma2 family endonuclease
MMLVVLESILMTAITIKLDPVVSLTTEQFYQICQENPELKLERTAHQEIVAMPPTGGETGRSNANINFQLSLWNNQTELGEVFDSSTGFSLPNGADRSPDAAWIEKSRWDALTTTQKQKFIPLCPDFLLEILSPTDSLLQTQQKMQEYLDNGCQLGWLINRRTKTVEIYRPHMTIEIMTNPTMVGGEKVLPGFILNLAKIWG